MALPEKNRELDHIGEQSGNRANREQDHDPERGHRSHDFGMDLHPERYPRESLSRLEEGILYDDLKRHEHDRLGDTIPDLEDRIDDVRNLRRTLMVSGTLILIFAWILAWWVGWDVRSGNSFFSTMWVVALIIGLGLIVWGSLEQHRVLRFLRRMRLPSEDRREQICSERELREGHRAV